MKTLIFSDVHLKVSPEAAQHRQEFVAFLRSIDPAAVNRVIVLGDLFDFWFEYKHAVFSGYFDALRALADMHDSGIELHLVCGNHDFWAGRFLEEELGFTIHQHDFRCDFGGKRVLFVHGDGQNPEDVSYRVYKRLARSRPVKWLFYLLHPDWAMSLAQAVSNASRALFERQSAKKGGETRSLHAFAKKMLADGEADVVMCGHTHDPVSEAFPTPQGDGLYINTGDWLEHRTCVEWDGDTFELKACAQPHQHKETVSSTR